jgi:hypothetical protein
MTFYVIAGRRTKNLVLATTLLEPSFGGFCVSCGFCRFNADVLPVMRSHGKSNRAPKGWEVIVRAGVRLSRRDELA